MPQFKGYAQTNYTVEYDVDGVISGLEYTINLTSVKFFGLEVMHILEAEAPEVLELLKDQAFNHDQIICKAKIAQINNMQEAGQ